MLNVVMVSVVLLDIIMLNVIMLSVIMLNVVAPGNLPMIVFCNKDVDKHFKKKKNYPLAK